MSRPKKEAEPAPPPFLFPNKPLRFYALEAIATSLDPLLWCVEPKWNGHRALPSCDKDGTVTVFSRHGRPLPLAKDNWRWLSMLPLPRPWILDGELTRSGRLFVWDFAIMGGVNRSGGCFGPRRALLQQLLPGPLTKDGKTVAVVESLPADEYGKILLKRADSELEGLVFKRLAGTKLWGQTSTSENADQLKYRFSR